VLRVLGNVAHGLTDDVVDDREPELALKANSDRKTNGVAEVVGRTTIMERANERDRSDGDNSYLVGAGFVVEFDAFHLANI
jgi:hypothetical protein